eukprot:5792522-Prymnesium_polylepis.1
MAAGWPSASKGEHGTRRGVAGCGEDAVKKDCVVGREHNGAVGVVELQQGVPRVAAHMLHEQHTVDEE